MSIELEKIRSIPFVFSIKLRNYSTNDDIGCGFNWSNHY